MFARLISVGSGGGSILGDCYRVGQKPSGNCYSGAIPGGGQSCQPVGADPYQILACRAIKALSEFFFHFLPLQQCGSRLQVQPNSCTRQNCLRLFLCFTIVLGTFLLNRLRLSHTASVFFSVQVVRKVHEPLLKSIFESFTDTVKTSL